MSENSLRDTASTDLIMLNETMQQMLKNIAQRIKEIT